MREKNYRLYCLDGIGHLHDAEWFNAESDDDAVTKVGLDHPDAMCEIWQGTRLVAKLSPKRRSA